MLKLVQRLFEKMAVFLVDPLKVVRIPAGIRVSHYMWEFIGMTFNGNHCTYLSTLSRVTKDFAQKNRMLPWWGHLPHLAAWLLYQ